MRYGLVVSAFLLGGLPALTAAADVVTVAMTGRESAEKDWQKELQRAFDKASQTAGSVKIGPGVFRHSGILKLQGVEVSGEGIATVLQPTDPLKASVLLTGSGSKLSHLKLVSEASERSSHDSSAQVLVVAAANFTVSGVTIDGSASAGILVLNSRHGTIENNDISNTLADSIHMTDGSSDLTVTGNTVRHSGDDGIAVVSYQKNSSRVARVAIYRNSVLFNKFARGISVVGGEGVDIHDNTVACDKQFAGIYIASEPSYHTYGASNVKVHDNSITGCGGPKYGHGAVMVYTGYQQNDHISVTANKIEQSPGSAIAIRGKDNNEISLRNNKISRSGGKPIDEDRRMPSPAEKAGNVIE